MCCFSTFLKHADLIRPRFDTLGSALTCSAGLGPGIAFSSGAQSLLQDEEGNSCSSFPTALLQLLQSGAQLSLPNHPSYSSTIVKKQKALVLLARAAAFDPVTWATKLEPSSPASDLNFRIHIASAHRAAVCIYLSRVLDALSPTIQIPHNLECLVAEIIKNLAHIRPSNALFKATTWPAFIAGAETNDLARQEWVTIRFQELWEVEPWGLLKGAVGLLERIWLARRKEIVQGEEDPQKGLHRKRDWIGDLKGSGVDWLIL